MDARMDRLARSRRLDELEESLHKLDTVRDQLRVMIDNLRDDVLADVYRPTSRADTNEDYYHSCHDLGASFRAMFGIE